MRTFIVLLASLIAVPSLNPVACTDEYGGNDYAIGTPGGARFEKEIGLDYALFILQNSSSAFYDIFNQSVNERKDIMRITLNIQPLRSGIVTNANSNINSQIFMSSNYLAIYNGDIKYEFTGIMYHEIARVRQWNGNGMAPMWLLTGIADFFRLKGGYASANWLKPGKGFNFDAGYHVTALFLDYCNNTYTGFVANLNAAMKNGYNNALFVQLTGKSADELWNDYRGNAEYVGSWMISV